MPDDGRSRGKVRIMCKAMARFDGETQVTIQQINVRSGFAGQLSVIAVVRYAYSDGETENTSHMVTGSAYGGPVVAHTVAGQVFVVDHGRFGVFSEDPREWMRRFVLNEGR